MVTIYEAENEYYQKSLSIQKERLFANDSYLGDSHIKVGNLHDTLLNTDLVLAENLQEISSFASLLENNFKQELSCYEIANRLYRRLFA
jgi:hypothetical protein